MGPSTNNQLRLYSSAESGNCHKVRLLLSILNVPHEEIMAGPVDRQEPSFIALNPKKEIPVLVHGDEIITDSSAILVYIAGLFPSPGDSSKAVPSPWWSAQPAEQAAIIQWLAFANGWVQYGVFTARAILSFGGVYNGLGKTLPKDSLDQATTRGKKSLDILNGHLTGKEWLALDRPTIADLAVFPYVALAPMGDISLEPYSEVKKWITRIKNLPGFVTMPGIDDPTYLKKS